MTQACRNRPPSRRLLAAVMAMVVEAKVKVGQGLEVEAATVRAVPAVVMVAVAWAEAVREWAGAATEAAAKAAAE